MKTQKRLVALLATLAMALSASAQTDTPKWLVYPRMYAYEREWVDSIVYTDKNYDVFVESTKDINDQGRWLMKVNGYGEISVATTKVGVVAAEVANEDIEQMFKDGRLTDLQEAKVDSSSIYNRYDFVVEEGAWKPVIFGYDAEGEYRGYYVGETQTFSSNFTADINAQLIRYDRGLSGHYVWGYGSIMHVRDVMGEDYATNGDYGTDWYQRWAKNIDLAANSPYSAFVWQCFFLAIDGLNGLVHTIERRNRQVNVSADLGYALALRAMLYLDAARMFEFLETDSVGPVNEAGNNVSGLTFPIVKEVWANPYPTDIRRATRDEMATYLTEELDAAEDALAGVSISDKRQASLAVVYGLKARLYMWLGDYAQAQMYAERTIAEGGYTPLTRDEWLSTTRGFNDRNVGAWMWAINYPEDCEVVQTAIINWTSWCSSEYTGGYTATGVYPVMGRAIYDRMADTDFRKLSYKAPSGTSLAGQEPHLDDNIYNRLPDYASLKFRPGLGNISTPKVACAVDVPLMRIEEMHFIQMEAMAQRDMLEAAKERLASFMQQYRDANYTCSAATKEELIDEIFLQKRIELWGEGQNYFDYKRLNKPVTRGYEGTNFVAAKQFNTSTRPAWMNFVFGQNAYQYWQVDSDTQGHAVYPLADWNNPDPSNCYTPIAY